MIKKTSIDRYDQLDGLRGILSLCIVFFHLTIEDSPIIIYKSFIVRELHIVVDFFFVLSGFVVALNYTNFEGVRDRVFFLIKRFLRLYPLVLFTLCVMTIYRIISVMYLNSSMDWLVFYTDFFETLLLQNSSPILGRNAGLNYPSWSISAEIYAYIFYVGLFYLHPFSRILMSVLTISLALLFFYKMDMFFFLGDFGFVRGLIGFNVGFLVFKLKDKISMPFYFQYLFLAGFILYLFLLNSYPQIILIPLGLPFFFGGLILSLISKNDTFLLDVLRHKWAIKLGDLSYSIYLNHALFLYLVPSVFFKIFLFESTELNKSMVLLFTIILLISYSQFTYIYVESIGKKVQSKIFSLAGKIGIKEK